jgi:hypothetical protein
MRVLYNWANARIVNTNTNQLPDSLRADLLRQSLLVQYIDEFLNSIIRKKLGKKWTSNEVVHSTPPKGRLSISPH